MNKSKLLATAFAAAAFTITSVQAGGHAAKEKCMVVKDGKGYIKEHKGDCSGKSNSCAGHNKAHDADAWIMVPKGDCDKINKGDFTGVADDIKKKIDMDGMMHKH